MSATIRDVFRKGYDTIDLAKLFGCSEAEASKRLYFERCKDLGVKPEMEPNPSALKRGRAA